MQRQRVRTWETSRPAEILENEMPRQKPSDPLRRVFVETRVAPATSVLMAYEPANQAKALDVLAEVGLLQTDLLQMEVSVRHIFSAEGGFSAELPERVIAALGSHDKVARVEAVRLFEVQLHESVLVHDVPVAWASGYGGSEVTIGILDTGINYSHSDFRNRVKLASSYNFTQEGSPTDIMDWHGHGTHVAGIVGGSGARSSTTLYKGVAPQVQFVALKVFDKTGRGYGDDIAAAVHRAIDLKVDVINFSGGHRPAIPSPWVYQANKTYEELSFEAAMTLGIPAVISAGNEGMQPDPKSTITMPATSDVVISVGSVTKNRLLSSFSSQGYVYRTSQPNIVQTFQPGTRVEVFDKPDIVAVGGEIDEEATCRYTLGIVSAKAVKLHPTLAPCVVDRSYVKCSGTSQAAPHITGIVALLIEAARHLCIDLTDQRAFLIKNILRRATVDLGLPETQQGKGLVTWPKVLAILSNLGQNPEMVDRYRIR